MAAPMNTAVSAPMLSQKQRKALLKKERRSRKRQALAEARLSGQGDGHHAPEEEEEEDNDRDTDTERQHQEWLKRELLAQQEFRLQMEREDTARKKQEEEERRIKEEWEAEQRKEQEEKEHKQQQKQDREEAVRKMLDQAESQLAAENGAPWMNAEPPDFGTEKDRDNCPFFIKTGACRFGDRCSRKHVHPESSPTLLVRGMFVTFGLDQSRRDDYDTDACLEYSEEEVQQQFLDFYQDVLPEFRTAGKVLQFKVSCNYEPHLRGNVYVQFDTEEQCREAFMMFNGRWYAGKQLQCELCPVTRWKTAICGLFDRQKCPKGKHCNFLHVFRNPGNEFWEADRDLHMSPDRDGGFSGRWSERRGRDWDHSWRSSAPRSERSHRGRERRSRSRERGGERDRRGSERGSERRRSRERGREGRSRSRERSRERGSERRSERRSRSRERRERARERRSREKRSRSRGKRSRSRESSSLGLEKRSRREGSRSPVKPIVGDATPDDVITPRHHKHSKKSKKSKKKKHKKKNKRSLLPGDSSGDSGKESGDDEDAPEVVLIPADLGSKPTNHRETEETEAAGEEAVSPDPQDPPLETHSDLSPTPRDPEPISYPLEDPQPANPPLKTASPAPVETETTPFSACAEDTSVPPLSGVELI
ncbi:U2 small nuclear ribonucleoprotein auxiliary factor 35 kDa subunit-related protein 2 [Hypomesus transpacificus]|uniref:U2 small nuclear ribonucleoprotein auxiliary factor 35 kDa subunit-related protein 2 n=1 Tax=Hypomesus transpacificus TaxID=137520 RepID=UPI001F087EB0|nr:U2 small nuclear ribonucleoprotein auxiliary factor 35 kDa subunit-related protein 2 [Hypomesus transpacificus]